MFGLTWRTGVFDPFLPVGNGSNPTPSHDREHFDTEPSSVHDRVDYRPPFILLERDSDCDPDAGITAVIQVIPVGGVIEIYIVVFVPRRRPRFRPRVHACHPIAVVLEARISADEDER